MEIMQSWLAEYAGELALIALLVLTGAYRVLAWVHAYRHRADACRDVLCAASEVARIAALIERELDRVQDHPKCQAYRLRCARLRVRADLALAHPGCVQRLSLRRVLRALSRFHSDLRKLKRFRVEFLAAASSWECARDARARQATTARRGKATLRHGYLLARS
ncbi:hypothetical protein JJ685_03560 [Ramlibacter monticola]|uniref:Uncharacterized protein n=1 Tax=Ramlibacter monticola TaxID=1926872 RepID=A0A936YX54_9BURK|nr:hypothetical protein [Ramlibacter monticola]MBL0390209.1 hypothetical protein [Ramlibacter monticola]